MCHSPALREFTLKESTVGPNIAAPLLARGLRSEANALKKLDLSNDVSERYPGKFGSQYLGGLL